MDLIAVDPVTAALKAAEAGFLFGAELCKLLASPNGKLIIENNIRNEERLQAVLKPIAELFDNGIQAIKKALDQSTDQSTAPDKA